MTATATFQTRTNITDNILENMLDCDDDNDNHNDNTNGSGVAAPCQRSYLTREKVSEVNWVANIVLRLFRLVAIEVLTLAATP